MKEKLKNKNNQKAITLVALVVTIIVLLMLAGVSVVTLFGESGIITKSQKAANETNSGVTNDTKDLGKIEKDMKKALGEVSVEVKLANGTNVELTKENYGEYLGKEVTNYKPTVATVQGTTVSNVYRLYYVDFDGKYGEKGTIYLKADGSGNSKLTLDTTSADSTNVKIKELNPGLYKDASGNAITPPAATNRNMKIAIWLTNTTNWASLKPEKTEANAEIVDKINYVVGAPSLEMMMDSYNAHYGLTGDTPDTTTTLQGTENRVKLFYQYTSGNTGYKVGPSDNSSAINGYYTITSNYSVKTDTNIDSMYYPRSATYYWLASPSEYDSNCANMVCYQDGGIISHFYWSGVGALCPLVSLKPSAQLELGE